MGLWVESDQKESSAQSHFVILSEAKDLVFFRIHEILRSLRSLIPSCNQKAIMVAAGFTVRLHRRDACATN